MVKPIDSFNALNLTMPKFDVPSVTLPDHKLNPAKWTHERLCNYIKTFEEGLDQEHEIGARLVSFGTTVTFHIEHVGYWGPDIISFEGKDEAGNKVQLIQHVSQLSVLLMAMKKVGEEPRRTGYILTSDTTAD